MTFNTVPIQVAGPSSPNRSAPFNAQSTVNLFPVLDNQSSNQFSLQSMWGAVQFGTASGVGRGLTKMGGIVYRVAGQTLYSVSSTGAHTSLGVISGTQGCIFANDGGQIAICNGDGDVYVYIPSSGLQAVTDADIVGSLAVDIINNQFVYTKPNLFVISDVSDATQASGLNAAQAEAQPDDLTRAFVFQQTIYMLGETSLEGWINTGTGSPPVQRIEQQVNNIGIAGRYAVASNDSFMYWLSDDYFVYRISGGAIQNLSSVSVAREFASYENANSCECYCFTLEGQNFVMFNFWLDGKTWCLNESLGQDGWFELSVNVGGDHFPYSSPIVAHRKILLEGVNGELVYLDPNTYTYDGLIAKRQRILSAVTSASLGVANKEMRISRIALLLESGVGLLSGQGEDPIIQVEASIDGGRTWQNFAWVKIGRLGAHKQEVRGDKILTCYECVFRLTCTDPVMIHLYSATIDAKLTGRA